MLYRIEFEADNGATYTKDNALIIASSPEEAEHKLRKFISYMNSETSVSEIFNISPYKGDIFTGRHGFTI